MSSVRSCRVPSRPPRPCWISMLGACPLVSHPSPRFHKDPTFLLTYYVSAKSKFSGVGLPLYISVDIDNNYLLIFCLASDIVLGPGETELRRVRGPVREGISAKGKQTGEELSCLPRGAWRSYGEHVGAPTRVTPTPPLVGNARRRLSSESLICKINANGSEWR